MNGPKIPLHEKKCAACAGATVPMAISEVKKYLDELGGGWTVVEGKLEKSYRFRDFKTALAFVDKVGKVAEEEGHHPDLYLSWGLVKIVLWTHKIKGLAESDFILAAKCDKLYC